MKKPYYIGGFKLNCSAVCYRKTCAKCAARGNPAPGWGVGWLGELIGLLWGGKAEQEGSMCHFREDNIVIGFWKA